MSRLSARDMVTWVRKSLGGVPLETLTDDEILQFINRAYVEICASDYYPILREDFVITMVNGQSEYEIDVDDVTFFWHAVDETQGLRLLEIDRRRYDNITQGKPERTKGNVIYWLTDGVGANNRRLITVWPTPTKTADIRWYYQRRPPYLQLEPTPTFSILYEIFDQKIIDLAVMKGLKLLGQRQEAVNEAQFLQQDRVPNRTVREHDEVGWELGNEVGLQTGFGRGN